MRNFRFIPRAAAKRQAARGEIREGGFSDGNLVSGGQRRIFRKAASLLPIRRKRPGKCSPAVALLTALCMLAAGAVGTSGHLTLSVNASVIPVVLEDGTIFDSDWYLTQLEEAGVTGVGTSEEELYRHYQLYGQGDGLTGYDDSLDSRWLYELRRYSKQLRAKLAQQNGEGWLSVTADIYDTEEVTFWNTDGAVSSETMAALQDAIALFEDKGYDLGFVAVDIEGGDAVAYRAGVEVYSASVIKGPYIFSLLESGIEPTNDMYLAGHASDNDAYKRLRTTYGHTVFAEWIEGTNIPYQQSQTRYITTTPLDLARMFYKGKDLLLGDEEYSDWARDTFTGSYNSAIALTVGQNKTVYSKAGWISGSGTYHSSSYTNAAIVDDGESPYVIAIMSNSPGYTGLQLAQELAPVLDQVMEELRQ